MRMNGLRTACFSLTLVVSACGGAQRPAAKTDPTAVSVTPPGATGTPTTAVTSFAVSEENLRVDSISMRDGGIKPDGNRDLVFTASVNGPADALYLVTCTEKGEPLHGFRADTISGHEELPPELGSIVDVGRLTVWIAVVENGKFINTDGGALGKLPEGPHSLKLYVPNTGNLRAGAHVRLFARPTGGGPLVGGPVVVY